MNEGSYTIHIDEDKKVVEIIVIGTFDANKAGEFHQEYLNRVSSLITNEYILLLDSLDMEVIKRYMLPNLQVSFAMYKKSGFKKIVFLFANDNIQTQVTRLINFAGITNYAFISPEERNDEFI